MPHQTKHECSLKKHLYIWYLYIALHQSVLHKRCENIDGVENFTNPEDSQELEFIEILMD